MPELPPRASLVARLAAIAALAGLYFLAANFGLSLGIEEQVTAVWPPSGIALAAMVLGGRRLWPGVWLGALAANLAANAGLAVALGIASGNTAEAVLGAALLQLFRVDRSLARPRDVLALLVAATLATVPAALIGVTSLCLGAVQPWARFPELAGVWWLGDAMGILLVGTFVLAWSTWPRWRPARVLELAVLVVGLALATHAVFEDPHYAHPNPLTYVAYPFVIWAAFRFGQPGTTLAIVTASAVSTWATVNGLGPFGAASLDERWLPLQAFTGILAISGTMLGAAISERDRLLARERTARTGAEALTASLREQQEAKDHFLALLGHELRNPLAPVSNALEVLLRRAPSAPEARELLELMERQVRHMARLVDDLLDVSRIARGSIELRRKRIDLRPVVERAAAASRDLFDQRRQRFTLRVPGEPVCVSGDETRLHQIVSNLLNNAARYTPSGGAIELALGREDGTAVVRVRDEGIGIKAEDLLRIFEVFTQADRVAGRVHEGLGIGLTLAQQLVERHGGDIRAHSDGPGRGSTFEVRLPLAAEPRKPPQPEPAARPQPQAPAALAPGSRRVLVVDDNRDAADTLALLLRAGGHEADVAYDGAEALAKFGARRPDVVLLDIELPHDLDGHAVATRMRALAGGAPVRLVALTGYGRSEDRTRSDAAGFDLHVVKPLDPVELERIVAP
jgi:signal transduction histidine kinase/CheY-like chemotaxis protein